ncbi:undecaprenyl diphosphate synthase family protein, partial [Escherichia coli]|uniref:undecaprenyl diphosphate synthase family protein n=1 Tax=Escherichia coli TaxID=562 RepID=UPI0028E09586
RFSPDIVALVDDALERTAANTGPILVIALNYGAQAEMVAAARALAARVRAGELEPDQIDEASFEGALETSDLPPLDLL